MCSRIPSMKNSFDVFHYIEHLNVEYVADLVFFRCLARAFESNSAVFSHYNDCLGSFLPSKLFLTTPLIIK